MSTEILGVKNLLMTRHAASLLWRYRNRTKEELYDIETDPIEMRDLAAEPKFAKLIDGYRRRHWH